MLNTGWLSPSDNDGGDYPWLSPEKAYSSDDEYAEADEAVMTNWADFNINIPAGATIKGIIVKLEGYYQTTLPTIWIRVWNNNSSSYGDKNWVPDSIENEKEVGGEADLWGKNWIIGDFSNANFKIGIYADGVWVYLDHLQVKVFYEGAIFLEAGSFTLTGQDTSLRLDRKIALAVGNFTLTGIDVGLSIGKRMLMECGNFALTGKDVGLRMARKLVCACGSFTLTGIDVILTKGKTMILECGKFILTGMAIKIKRGFRNRAKNSTSFTNKAKSSTSFTNKSKNNTNWTNRNKN